MRKTEKKDADLEKCRTGRRARRLAGLNCFGARIGTVRELIRVAFGSSVDEVIDIKTCKE